MGIGQLIDSAIAPFSPRLAARRVRDRIALEGVRQYDAAARDRRTKGWKRPSTSADAENWRAATQLRNGARDLVRNSKYASAAVRQITGNLIGDGIAPQFDHEPMQKHWDSWAEKPVDGFDDFYGVEKVAVRGMVEGGETLNTWKPGEGGPDGRCELLEGDFLDDTKTTGWKDSVRDVQGVRLNADGDRVGYWLHEVHPGDTHAAHRFGSELAAAQNVDHLFERLRAGQTRGVSWLAASALTFRDINDIEDAFRLKKKVEACFAMIITPGSDDQGQPLTPDRDRGEAGRPDVENLSPAAVMRLRTGDTANFANPTATGDTLQMVRQSIAGISATLAPYHLISGDVSQATYTSLRAANLGHWAMLDDWQQNVVIPRLVRPAVLRRQRRAWLETGDRRMLDCKVAYVLPVRRVVDPIKDLMAEILEIRAGLKLLPKALAERGINSADHLQQLQDLNQTLDRLKVVLETDPRKLTKSGVLQLAAPYLYGGQSGAAPADTSED